ncbi:hypothetical protein EON65_16580 [archaeon]|nr:MAG: hypothetical protein EON65_16580 [archaeon]
MTLVDGQPQDHVSIKAQLSSAELSPSSQELALIEEELRSALLRLCMLEGSLSSPPEDKVTTWTIMVVTKPSGNLEEEGRSL